MPLGAWCSDSIWSTSRLVTSTWSDEAPPSQIPIHLGSLKVQLPDNHPIRLSVSLSFGFEASSSTGL